MNLLHMRRDERERVSIGIEVSSPELLEVRGAARSVFNEYAGNRLGLQHGEYTLHITLSPRYRRCPNDLAAQRFNIMMSWWIIREINGCHHILKNAPFAAFNIDHLPDAFALVPHADRLALTRSHTTIVIDHVISQLKLSDCFVTVHRQAVVIRFRIAPRNIGEAAVTEETR